MSPRSVARRLMFAGFHQGSGTLAFVARFGEEVCLELPRRPARRSCVGTIQGRCGGSSVPALSLSRAAFVSSHDVLLGDVQTLVLVRVDRIPVGVSPFAPTLTVGRPPWRPEKGAMDASNRCGGDDGDGIGVLAGRCRRADSAGPGRDTLGYGPGRRPVGGDPPNDGRDRRQRNRHRPGGRAGRPGLSSPEPVTVGLLPGTGDRRLRQGTVGHPVTPKGRLRFRIRGCQRPMPCRVDARFTRPRGLRFWSDSLGESVDETLARLLVPRCTSVAGLESLVGCASCDVGGPGSSECGLPDALGYCEAKCGDGYYACCNYPNDCGCCPDIE